MDDRSHSAQMFGIVSIGYVGAVRYGYPGWGGRPVLVVADGGPADLCVSHSRARGTRPDPHCTGLSRTRPVHFACHVPSSERMAYAQERPGVTGSINEHASALAGEWRRLTRAATCVALLTAPAFFFILFDSDHWSLVASLIVTALAVVTFRGLVEVLTRKLIPSPSLYGADMSLKQDDIVARRRDWYWGRKLRRLP